MVDSLVVAVAVGNLVVVVVEDKLEAQEVVGKLRK